VISNDCVWNAIAMSHHVINIIVFFHCFEYGCVYEIGKFEEMNWKIAFIDTFEFAIDSEKFEFKLKSMREFLSISILTSSSIDASLV
jgi:hypothetical protein